VRALALSRLSVTSPTVVIEGVRVSTNRRANAGNGTNNETSTERRTPAPQLSMTDQERQAIRQAGAEDARRSRVDHGLPERVEDAAAVATLAAILRSIPAPRLPSESTADEGNPET
jgi:hypothetical protein